MEKSSKRKGREGHKNEFEFELLQPMGSDVYSNNFKTKVNHSMSKVSEQSEWNGKKN
jgi:hypothetical protein